MRWLEDPPLPAADLAAIKVPVMILAGELDQVRLFLILRPSTHLHVGARLINHSDLNQISPLSAAEEWRDAFIGGMLFASDPTPTLDWRMAPADLCLASPLPRRTTQHEAAHRCGSSRARRIS